MVCPAGVSAVVADHVARGGAFFFAKLAGSATNRNVVDATFRDGTLGLVLRGADETLDVTTDVFVETTFVATLNTPDSPMKEL